MLNLAYRPFAFWLVIDVFACLGLAILVALLFGCTTGDIPTTEPPPTLEVTPIHEHMGGLIRYRRTSSNFEKAKKDHYRAINQARLNCDPKKIKIRIDTFPRRGNVKGQEYLRTHLDYELEYECTI